MPGMTLAFAALLACSSGADYGLAAPPDQNPPGYDTIRVFVDVALQRTSFGQQVGRCQIQVAFEPVVWGDQDDQPASEPPWAVAYPDQAGTCAFSTEPLPEEGEPSAPDNWYVSGSLIGPPSIALTNMDRRIELLAVESEDGRVRYELPDCSEHSFPTREVFNLDVPETDDDGPGDTLPAFRIMDAFAVGPDVHLTTPIPDPDIAGPLPHPIDTDLDVAWQFDGDPPSIGGQVLDPRVELKLYNQDDLREQENQWLVCLPDDDGRFRLGADDLAAMTANPDPADDRWAASLTVHTITESPPFDTPWGESVQINAHISEGGFISLHE